MTCVIICALAGLAAHTAVGEDEQPEEKTSEAKLRVGIFDSRALAIAYGQSKVTQDKFKELRAERQEAKNAGDQKLAGEVQSRIEALRTSFYKQAHGIGPIANILEIIKDKIPGIAEEAKVDVIIRKWDIVYQRPDIEFVDVTDLMVKPFNPKDSTKVSIKSILANEPVPLNTLKK